MIEYKNLMYASVFLELVQEDKNKFDANKTTILGYKNEMERIIDIKNFDTSHFIQEIVIPVSKELGYHNEVLKLVERKSRARSIDMVTGLADPDLFLLVALIYTLRGRLRLKLGKWLDFEIELKAIGKNSENVD